MLTEQIRTGDLDVASLFHGDHSSNNSSGKTLLMSAVEYNQPKLVEALLKHSSVNVSVKNFRNSEVSVWGGVCVCVLWMRYIFQTLHTTTLPSPVYLSKPISMSSTAEPANSGVHCLPEESLRVPQSAAEVSIGVAGIITTLTPFISPTGTDAVHI